MSKNTKGWIAALAVALLGGVGVTLAMHDKNPPTGVAVVELFTSEGCSSCPPADAFLAKLVNEGRDHVYPLAFHVDYWDTPQWRDAFSDARFSRRQEGCAKASGSRDVYTPQMIVNGSKGFVGSDEQVARSEIAAALKQKAAVSLELAVRRSAGQVTVDCKTDAAGVGKMLNLALVERGIRRKIGGGENAGRSLSHENVVRAFESMKTTGPRSTVSLVIPAAAVSAQCSVIAYVQDESMHVMGAGAVNLATVH
jgi:hypothetical protein